MMEKPSHTAQVCAGDIDFLIMPPPSRSTVACGELLQALLMHLLKKGILLDEMSPERPRPKESGSATWLGLCKPPGSPYVRRIDFKVYPVKYVPSYHACCAL